MEQIIIGIAVLQYDQDYQKMSKSKARANIKLHGLCKTEYRHDASDLQFLNSSKKGIYGDKRENEGKLKVKHNAVNFSKSEIPTIFIDSNNKEVSTPTIKTIGCTTKDFEDEFEILNEGHPKNIKITEATLANIKTEFAERKITSMAENKSYDIHNDVIDNTNHSIKIDENLEPIVKRDEMEKASFTIGAGDEENCTTTLVIDVLEKSTDITEIDVLEKSTDITEIDVLEKSTDITEIDVLEKSTDITVIDVLEKSTDITEIDVLEKSTDITERDGVEKYISTVQRDDILSSIPPAKTNNGKDTTTATPNNFDDKENAGNLVKTDYTSKGTKLAIQTLQTDHLADGANIDKPFATENTITPVFSHNTCDLLSSAKQQNDECYPCDTEVDTKDNHTNHVSKYITEEGLLKTRTSNACSTRGDEANIAEYLKHDDVETDDDNNSGDIINDGKTGSADIEETTNTSSAPVDESASLKETLDSSLLVFHRFH